MIEPLKNHEHDGVVSIPTHMEIVAKVNEVIAHINAVDESLRTHTAIQLDGEKEVSSAEPTEKMYTIDEVAEMLQKAYDVVNPCNLKSMGSIFKADAWCQEECFKEHNSTDCWKHAIESGWLKRE